MGWRSIGHARDLLGWSIRASTPPVVRLRTVRAHRGRVNRLIHHCGPAGRDRSWPATPPRAPPRPTYYDERRQWHQYPSIRPSGPWSGCAPGSGRLWARLRWRPWRRWRAAFGRSRRDGRRDNLRPVPTAVPIGAHGTGHQVERIAGSRSEWTIGGRWRTLWHALQNLYSPVRIRSSPPNPLTK